MLRYLRDNVMPDTEKIPWNSIKYGRCCEFHLGNVYERRVENEDEVHLHSRMAKRYYHHYDFLHPTIVSMTGLSIRYAELE